MWIGHEETPSAAVWELHPIVLETSPWACRACVTQEYFSRFQAVNTFLKMQVCDFCFFHGLTPHCISDSWPFTCIKVLFPGFLAGIQLNLSYNSIRIQPVPCLAVSQPWQPFMGGFATALLQPPSLGLLCVSRCLLLHSLPSVLFPAPLPMGCCSHGTCPPLAGFSGAGEAMKVVALDLTSLPPGL